MAYQNPDGSFENQVAGATSSVYAPLTGTTVALRLQDLMVYFNTAGTLAALTVKLPPTTRGGHKVELYLKNIVTTLAINDSAGGAIAGTPTTAAAGLRVVMLYVSKAVGWVKWA